MNLKSRTCIIQTHKRNAHSNPCNPCNPIKPKPKHKYKHS